MLGSLVILAVALVKKLQMPSNYLIVSLAFGDLSVAILAMPIAAITTLKEIFHLEESVCNVFQVSDVLLVRQYIIYLNIYF